MIKLRPLRLLGPTLGLLLGACTLANDPGPQGPEPPAETPPPPQAVTRSFGGAFSVQGTTFPVRLTFTSVGDEVPRARLVISELDMEATGDGSLQDGRLRLDLEYSGDCAGEVKITGMLQSAGQVVRGVLAAKDCTGEEEGGLVVRLQRGDLQDHRR